MDEKFPHNTKERFNPAMLRLARAQAGISQSILRQTFELSQSRWSKLETGAAEPSETQIIKFAKYFNYPLSFFFQSSLDFCSGLIYHRKRSVLSASLRDRIEAEVRLRAFDIAKIFNEFNKAFTPIPSKGLTPEELAQKVRQSWNLKSGPIENLTKLFEFRSIAIVAFDFGTELLDGFMVPISNEIPCIAINTNKVFSADRQRLTLAHEFGHFLMHRESVSDENTENEANRFAAEFLMPASVISNQLMPPLTLRRLGELKQYWRTSMLSLTYRAHQLGKINDKIYKNIMIYLSKNGYRKHEPSCGLIHEQPILLKSLVQEYVDNVANPLENLRLTRDRFIERYPNVVLDKEVVMA